MYWKKGLDLDHILYKNVEPVAVFKQIPDKIIEVKDYGGSEKGWRIVKEFIGEHQMSLGDRIKNYKKMSR